MTGTTSLSLAGEPGPGEVGRALGESSTSPEEGRVVATPATLRIEEAVEYGLGEACGVAEAVILGTLTGLCKAFDTFSSFRGFSTLP